MNHFFVKKDTLTLKLKKKFVLRMSRKKLKFSEFVNLKENVYPPSKKSKLATHFYLSKDIQEYIFSFIDDAYQHPLDIHSSHASYFFNDCKSLEFDLKIESNGWIRMMKYEWLHLYVEYNDIYRFMYIFQIILLHTDVRKVLGRYKPLRFHEDNTSHSMFNCSQLNQIYQTRNKTKKISFYSWRYIHEVQFQFYDYHPYQVKNKIPYFSHIFIFNVRFIKLITPDLICNPRYEWNFHIGFSELIKFQKWVPDWIKKVQLNSKLLQNRNDDQILKALISEEIEILKMPTFCIHTLNLIDTPSYDYKIYDNDLIIKTIDFYFSFNTTPIHTIVLQNSKQLKCLMKNGMHKKIQYFKLNENISLDHFSSLRPQLVRNFEPTLKIEQLAPFSSLKIHLHELVDTWNILNSSSIQQIQVFLNIKCPIPSTLTYLKRTYYNDFIVLALKWSDDEFLFHVGEELEKSYNESNVFDKEICSQANDTKSNLKKQNGKILNWNKIWSLRLHTYHLRRRFWLIRKQ